MEGKRSRRSVGLLLNYKQRGHQDTDSDEGDGMAECLKVPLMSAFTDIQRACPGRFNTEVCVNNG